MPQSAKTYSTRLYDAIELAARAHHGQVRKGTEIPYLVHPLAVASILITAGSREDVVIAGLLHDTLEDTALAVEDLRAKFGPQVAEWVRELSEPDKKAPWEARKTHTLDHLEHGAGAEILLISLADKLDNILAVHDGIAKSGSEFWQRFNRPRESQEWYYKALRDIFVRRLAGNAAAAPLVARFSAEVENAFQVI